jgi:5-aminopentanamidase
MKHKTPDGLVRAVVFCLCLVVGLAGSVLAAGREDGERVFPPLYRGVVKVAAAQTQPVLFDKAHNMADMLTKTEAAAAAGAKLIVFPEMALAGYKFKTIAEGMPYAETIPGPSVETLADAAHALGIYIVFGLLERQGLDLFDSMALVGPEGYIGKYRKAHSGFASESTFFSRGDSEFPVFATAIGRIGMGNCYDQTLPEGTRVAALKGADILALSYADGGARWFDYVRSRAAENNVYAVGANRVGDERFATFTGSSLIAGPDWTTYAQADGVSDTVIYADIDLSLLDKSWLHGRRPELYGPIDEPLPRQILALDFNPESQVFGTAETVIVRAVTASVRRHTQAVAELLADGALVARAEGRISSQGVTIPMDIPADLPVGAYTLRVTVAGRAPLSIEKPYIVKDVLRPRVLGAIPAGPGAATKGTIYLGFDVDVRPAATVPLLVSDGTTTLTFTGKVNTTAELDNRLSAAYTGLKVGKAYTATLPADTVFSAVSGFGNEAMSFSFTTAPTPFTVKTAVVQMSPTFKANADNLVALLGALDTAAAAGAKLAVFPELALSGNGFTSKEEALPYAEALPGPSVDAVTARAQALGIYAAFGILEKAPKSCGHGHCRHRSCDHQQLFDTYVLVGPEGLVGKYRKAHLNEANSRFLEPGDLPFPTFDLAIGKVGLMLGDDVFFPEVARVQFLQGATVVAMGANLSGTLWTEQARTRGGENKVYIVAANHVGNAGGVPYGGLSIVAGSTRTVAVQASAGNAEIVYATLDVSTMSEKLGRGSVDQSTGKVRYTHYLLDRRPDLYDSLTRRGHDACDRN